MNLPPDSVRRYEWPPDEPRPDLSPSLGAYAFLLGVSVVTWIGIIVLVVKGGRWLHNL